MRVLFYGRNGKLLGSYMLLDAFFDFLAVCVLGDFEVVLRLQAHPDAGTGAEVSGQSHGGVGGDRSFFAHDLADAQRRHADVVGDAVLAEA